MFYKEEWLKKGGRFYICWLADSWPSRFMSIPQRQLWSEDIVKLSHDLQEVVNSESGRPFNRFSLRLSSQLLRGLVRLYQRKANAVLDISCNLDSKTMRSVNKKFAKKQRVETKSSDEDLHIKDLFIEKDKENDEEMHRILVHRGAIVPNIESITLKEPIIPEVLLPRDDGFGEEHPNQLLQQLLGDRTVEEMLLRGEQSLIQISGLDVTRLDFPDKLLDITNMPPRRSLHMEKIPDQNITPFNKSGVEELLPIADNEKDIPPIPEFPLPPQIELPVPEVPIPEAPVPEEPIPEVPVPQENQIAADKEVTKGQEAEIEQMPVKEPAKRVSKRNDTVVPDLELQELEDTVPPKRRRRARKGPIIDNAIHIDTETFRARLEDNYVECKCITSIDDLANLNIPVRMYFRRPCHGGHKVFPNIANTVSRMFMRNLAVVQKRHEEKTQDKEVPVPSPPRGMLRRSAVETTVIINDTEPSIILPTTEPTVLQEIDISLMPTQKLDSPPKKQRRSIEEPTASPKKRRVGLTTIRKTRLLDISVPILDQEKENIPPHRNQNVPPQIQQELPSEQMQLEETLPPPEPQQPSATEKRLMSLLEEAGIAEIETRPDDPKRSGLEEEPKSRRTERFGSESSETPLGSLDRTKVSLGDSAKTNDSIRRLREEWGTYRTMLKIADAAKRMSPSPITVHTLVANIPDGTGRKRIAAARCFASVLKLKQYNFIKVIKEPGTQNIQNIILGPSYIEIMS